MTMTWQVGARVRPKGASRERTFVVQKVIVVKRGGFIRRGEHLYMIKDLQNGQLSKVRGESLVRV